MRSHHSGCGWVLLTIFLAGMVATAEGQSGPTLALLRSGARPLVVGGVSEYTPFNVVGPDGQLTGMDREIIRAATKRLGIKQVDFKTMTFRELGPSLLDRKIDLIANNYWPTPDRERLYAFTMPYFVRGGVGSLWIEGTGQFDTAARMAGKRIAVVISGAIHDALSPQGFHFCSGHRCRDRAVETRRHILGRRARLAPAYIVACLHLALR